VALLATLQALDPKKKKKKRGNGSYKVITATTKNPKVFTLAISMVNC
jgi:hypothetical protein